jgi:hypothetical protein
VSQISKDELVAIIEHSIQQIPDVSAGIDNAVWIEIFSKVFGEEPKGNDDLRWDILFRNQNGHGYNAMTVVNEVIAQSKNEGRAS